MRRRHLVIALALVVAFAVVTPTLGSQAMKGNSFANQNSKAAKRIALLAKGIAQKANRKANKNRNAIQDVDADLSTVEGQVNELNGKVNTLSGQVTAVDARVGAVEGELAASKAKTATAAGTVSTDEQADYVDLGGPSVTVTVPASGLIQVWAQVSATDGAVSLYEDGQQVPGQDPDDACLSLIGGPPPPENPLLVSPGGPELTVSTPAVVGFAGCASTTAPSPVLFSTSPGPHTYSLRYAYVGCGCEPNADFSDRMLTVAPLP